MASLCGAPDFSDLYHRCTRTGAAQKVNQIVTTLRELEFVAIARRAGTGVSKRFVGLLELHAR